MRPPEEFRLQGPPECGQRRKGRDRPRQSVPHLRPCDGEGAVSDRPVGRSRNVEERRSCGAQSATRADVGDTLQLAGEVPRRCTAQAAVDQDGEPELDPLRELHLYTTVNGVQFDHSAVGLV